MEEEACGQAWIDDGMTEVGVGIAPLRAAAEKPGGNREGRREAEAGDDTPADHVGEEKDPAEGSLGKTGAAMKEGCGKVCGKGWPE